jgi:uncharacterized protein (DUF1015 family)
MAFEVALDNTLTITIESVGDIQRFYDVMQKVNKRKFSVGFGIPNLTKSEKEMVEGFIAAMQSLGFSNPKIDELTIEKVDEKKSKDTD